MQLFYGFQNLVLTVMGVAALGAIGFSFVDVLRRPEAAFVAAGKRTKNFWMLVTGVALAVAVVSVFNILNFVGIIAVVAGGVYLADVRPALMQVMRGRRW